MDKEGTNPADNTDQPIEMTPQKEEPDNVEDELDIDRIQTAKKAADEEEGDNTLNDTQNAGNETILAQASSKQKKTKKVETPGMRNRKSLMRWNFLSVCFGALVSLALLFLFYKGFKCFSNEVFPHQSIEEAWKDDVIYDIKNSVKGKCPEKAEPALNYQWPGTVEGCDCMAANPPSKEVRKGKCSKADLSKGCTVSPPSKAVNFTKWKENDEFCLLREKGVSMDTMIFNSVPDEEGKCKEGFKICPPEAHDLETKKKVFSWSMCVPKTLERCPISSIMIASCKTNPNTECYSGENGDSIKLNKEDVCLYKSWTCGRGPIARIAMDEDTVCRHEADQQISENHTEYPLSQKPRKRCLVNTNAVKVDSDKQEDVLKRFKVPYDKIGHYKENIQKHNYSLFYVNYNRWVWKHRKPLDVELVFQNKKKMDELQKHHSEGIEFFLIGLFVFVIVAPVLLWFESRSADFYRERKILLLGKYLLMWFFKITAIPVIALIMMYNTQIWKKFAEFSKSRFSNAFENHKIHQMSKTIEEGPHFWDQLALYVACSALVVDLILIAIICRLEKAKMHHEDLDLEETLTETELKGR